MIKLRLNINGKTFEVKHGWSRISIIKDSTPHICSDSLIVPPNTVVVGWVGTPYTEMHRDYTSHFKIIGNRLFEAASRGFRHKEDKLEWHEVKLKPGEIIS